MIRTHIVDDVPLRASVIAAVLHDAPDIEVAGRSGILESALAWVDGCDVMLMNAALRNSKALEFTRAVARANSSVKVVILGLGEVEPAIIRFVEAGAAGYVTGDATVEELLQIIREVYKRRMRISPKMAAALMSRIAELAVFQGPSYEERQGSGRLTPREHDVLGLVAQGHTNQQIAKRLTIEVGTVKNHVHNILSKLEVTSRGDAASYYHSASYGRFLPG